MLLSVFISMARDSLQFLCSPPLDIFIPHQTMSTGMRSPFLGKITLFWCDACHVPVLEKKCACGVMTREVPISPPGDIRPAFPADVAHINEIYTNHFGSPLIPRGHLALLNKVPDTDRMEEIIVGGAVAGAIRYLPQKNGWEAIPHLAGKDLTRPEKRYLIVDDDAAPFIRAGANVLAPGLHWIDEQVQEGDGVIIYSEEGACIGVGRARVNAATARMIKHGMIARTRKNTPASCIPGKATWEQAVAANEPGINDYEDRAIRFVQETVTHHPELAPTVAYSGGKDSLATLRVVLKAIGRVPLLFADSGFEFPETLKNLEQVAAHYELELVRIGKQQKFWQVFEEKGPPAVNARWCCEVCKLEPLDEYISRRWKGCLSFIGQRRYESFIRMHSSQIWRNRKIPSQLSAAPLQQWTALHVWLYLFRERAPYNVLYEQGFDRIGCYICPSSDLATQRFIEETKPHLWSTWKEHLETWRLKNGLPEQWILRGEWRQQRA